MKEENPAYLRYVILLSMVPGRSFDQQIIEKHVGHIRALDDDGKLVLCGPFLDWKGGMVVIRAGSIEEAQAIARADPFVAEGFETFEVRTLHLGCKENNYLLDD